MRSPMALLQAAVQSVPVFYLAMLWPGRSAFRGLWSTDAYYPAIMYDSGAWSVWLLIATLSVTPILLLINRIGRVQGFGRWLLRRRRHLGLGSAIYAALHLWYYLAHERSLPAVLFDLWQLEFAVGWLSFALFVILALTSNAWSVRRLGRKWKSLHLLVYPAAALALWHWHLLDWYVGRSIFWCGVCLVPLVIRPALRRVRRPIQS
ncbi:ferric reductase-like transmembrane domain-containing protein [uncultured Tateyamaria sp.]|uniref:ferric reductase-like transmembrane domain-containing protein n=1 Tax=uncultured Tateyamaria sp. TaxID=455651 RepID=UPI0026387FEC|nr:ferric reductase-like transmembrane domain-containing protein [uncultured Tateyamaria sp.]